MNAVVEAGDVDDSAKAIVGDASYLVHTAGYKACGILAVAYILQEYRLLPTCIGALVGYLVADTPHNDRGRIAVVVQHIYHIALCPLIEEAVVAILTLCDIPLIEGLNHHHKAHFIA